MAGAPNVFDAARDAAKVLEKLDDADREGAAVGCRCPRNRGTVARSCRVGRRRAWRRSRARGAAVVAAAVPRQKDFIDEKDPQSKLEEIACLAYYLSHHRSKPKWKPADIAALNSEAHGHAFENVDATSATRSREAL